MRQVPWLHWRYFKYVKHTMELSTSILVHSQSKESNTRFSTIRALISLQSTVNSDLIAASFWGTSVIEEWITGKRLISESIRKSEKENAKVYLWFSIHFRPVLWLERECIWYLNPCYGFFLVRKFFSSPCYIILHCQSWHSDY